MAIARVDAQEVLNTSANQDTYTSSNYTPASDSNVLVIWYHCYLSSGGDDEANCDLLWNGNILTPEFRVRSSSRAWLACCVVTSPGTSAAQAEVQYDTGLTNGGRAQCITIIEYSGVDTTNPVTATDTDAQDGTSMTLTIVTSDDGAMMVAGWSVESDETPFTASDGATELLEGATGSSGFNDVCYTVVEESVASAGSNTVGTSWATTESAAGGAVELKPAGGGGASRRVFVIS